MGAQSEDRCTCQDPKSKKSSKGKSEKKFVPTRIPRYLHGQVDERLLIKDLQDYNKHRYIIFHITAKVDSKPPLMNPNRYCNTQRLLIDERRVAEINRENKEIIKRINKINRFGGNLDTFNRFAYAYRSKWGLHKEEMERIVVHNRKIYKALKKAKSVYLTKNYEKFWKHMVRKMHISAKFPLVVLDKKPLDVLVREQPSISNGEFVERPQCFMDFRVKDGVYLGRIIIDLYHDYVPVTVQNFMSICCNQDGLTYKNCEIHKIYSDSHIEMGDITKGSGKGGISIYGNTFAEENHVLKHSKMGVLSMIPVKPKVNNSQFCIALKPMETFDKTRVVFGKVVQGNNTLCKLNDLGRKFGKPIARVVVENCGLFVKGEMPAQIRNFKYARDY